MREKPTIREIKKISQLTGHEIDTVLAYFKMIDWGLSSTEAAKIARSLEKLGLVKYFYSRETNGLPWYISRPKIEASLLISLALSLGYMLTYII